jgi:hypothetical protein
MKKALFTVSLLIALGLAIAPVGARQTSGEKLEITAFAVSMGTVGTGANAVVDIDIDRWSTAKERELLITTMVEKNSDALLRALQKMPSHGRFSIPGLQGPDPHQLRLGNPLRYAWQTPTPEGGRRIVIATDRYIGFAEARNQPRTIDYPFTLFEIRVDKAGQGQGKMAVATKISFDKKKNTIELENYSSEPVRLNEVKVKVKT